MEKLMEVFKSLNRFIEQQHILILAIITILFIIMLVILLVKNKRIYCFETLLFIIPLIVIGFDYYARYVSGHTYYIKGNEMITLRIISTYIYALALLIAFVVFIICISKNNSISNDKEICGIYLNKNKKLVFNKNFDKIFNFLGKNKWNEECGEILIDGEKVELENLGEHINQLNNGFLMKLFFTDKKEVNITIAIIKTSNGFKLKVVDYEICEVIKEKVNEKKELPEKNIVRSLSKSLESLNEPIGYFDSSINQYRLTTTMQNKLNYDFQTISSDEFSNYVHSDDYVTYEALCKQKSGSYKYRYRLKTCDGIEWYEEVRSFENGELISTFHKVLFESNGIAIFNRDELTRDLDTRISKKEEFGLLFLYSEKAQSFIRKFGSDANKVIIENYFKLLKENSLSSEDNIYKISNSEYCILFSEIKDYYIALESLNKSHCDFVKNDIYFEGKKYTVTNTLGFVQSDDVRDKKSFKYIEAGLLSLYLAHNDEKNYYIYSLNNTKDEEFESYKVDLDNTFLDKL